MAIALVELACAADGIGHRHIGVVVKVERGACGKTDGVGAQGGQRVSAIAHIQSTARDGGGACVGVGTLHDPLARASFGEAADACVVGQHGRHGVVGGVGAGQGQQSTRCAVVGQRAYVAKHQSACARCVHRGAAVAQGEQAVGAGGGACVLERGVVDDQVSSCVAGLADVADLAAVSQARHRQSATLQVGHTGVGVGRAQCERVGCVLDQVTRATDGLGEGVVGCLVEAQAAVVDDISHDGTRLVQRQETSINGGESAVGVHATQVHGTSALLHQVGVSARNDARQNAAATAVVQGQRAACGQADVVGAVDVCATQQHITGSGVGRANGAIECDVAAIDSDGAIDGVARRPSDMGGVGQATHRQCTQARAQHPASAVDRAGEAG